MTSACHSSMSHQTWLVTTLKWPESSKFGNQQLPHVLYALADFKATSNSLWTLGPQNFTFTTRNGSISMTGKLAVRARVLNAASAVGTSLQSLCRNTIYKQYCLLHRNSNLEITGSSLKVQWQRGPMHSPLPLTSPPQI